MTLKKLPTWCEIPQPTRYILLGELIDAMIYSGEALMQVEILIEEFKRKGLVKSIILPLETELDNQ